MDVEDSRQGAISLVIKTPSRVREETTVDGVRLDWTVEQLKTHLSTVYPTKPAVADQRLIYAGKLLPNHLHVRDIFRKTDSTPTLHLVCTFRSPPQVPLGARSKTTETEQPHLSSSTLAATPRPGTSSTVETSSPPELRQRRQSCSPAAAASPSWTPPAASAAAQIAQPTFPNYSLYSPQQILWLQHVYARQYYMQYHAALAAAGSALSAPASVSPQYPPVPAHQVPVPAPLANQNPINNLPVDQNPAQGGAFINPREANQNLRMNAQGGPVMEDDEAMERDWLDWFYSAARFCVLLMILYFNSNLSRFLLVMSTLLLMYLHTAGRFPFRRPQVQEPNHLQPPEIQHNEDRVPNPDPVDERPDRQRDEPAATDSADTEGQMAAVLVPPHRVSVMWTAWVFFKTFFSSLIPEVPQGVAN